jgi:hypothetical protein
MDVDKIINFLSPFANYLLSVYSKENALQINS